MERNFLQACAPDLLSTGQDLVRCPGAAPLSAAHPTPILWDCLVWPDSAPWPHHICAEVDAEDGHSAQGQGDIGNDEQQEGGDLGDVAGQGVCDGLLQVVKDQAACREALKASGRFRGTLPTLAPELRLAAHFFPRGGFKA